MLANLLEKEGIRYSVEGKVLAEKSKDWSFTSPILQRYIKNCDIVTFPRNEEEVIKIVEIAKEIHFPLIPRGAGYGTVGGLIPLKGGIIVDLGDLSGVIEEDDESITLYAGTPFFKDGKFTFNPRVYPTIYQKSSVGGYFSGGSWGIGSFMFGPNWDQVVEVTMVNPQGKVAKLRGGDIRVAAHAEGTTGIVTKLRVLKLKYKEIPRLYIFDNIDEAIGFVKRIYEEAFPAYHVTLRSPEISQLTKGITGLDLDKWSVLVVSEDEFDSNGLDGSPLWNKRNVFFAGVYANVAVKTKVFYSQYHINISEIVDSIRKVKEKFPQTVIEAEFANDWKGHTYFMVFDESSFYEVNRIMGSTTFDLHSIKINNRLEKSHLQRIRMYKRMYDKEDLFNPGKLDF
ncbi:FAD-binding oxidoreductase [Acidianus sp. RZ1]|uniref:FAD-binding oxidoreductase n=1 Tax=Acidianus sp. RZ1 TaxID=1540082 RepID=UPI001491B973|nr:FAD-binding oxidoreductase [Acidianus sp. RZ1]NON62296.1 FAD-binding oxidoreductase [Acidianus sp. RZ1]